LGLWICAAALAAARAADSGAATPVAGPADDLIGPYNARFLQGGVGIERRIAADSPLLGAGAAWSITSWIRIEVADARSVVVASLGKPDGVSCVCVTLEAGHPALRITNGARIDAPVAIAVGEWIALAATDDGRVARLYVNGREVGAGAHGPQAADPLFVLAPSLGEPGDVRHFGGSVAGFRWVSGAMGADRIAAFAAAPPHFETVNLNAVGVGWPLQQSAWIGLQQPQEAWTLPRSAVPPSAPIAKPAPPGTVTLRNVGAGTWVLPSWRLTAAREVAADGAHLSSVDFDAASWLAATVPGTVLQTLIDRGIYPDPDYGLNNLAIPESLARQDYWYRTAFDAPAAVSASEWRLLFNGINYAAEVWFNGVRLGAVTGAFVRGEFDVTPLLHRGARNALAVRVSPPPHPGIPSEESIAFGPGENGGAMALDGPTFLATEGWDWIPAIRDRDTGIWQAVELLASGGIRIGDATVITHLPLPAIDRARLELHVPLDNRSSAPRRIRLTAAFDGVTIEKSLRLAPGPREIVLDAREFRELAIADPRLWWPNGYGPATLHLLHLTVDVAGHRADTRDLRFGMRELSYELSLFDSQGRLRRVEVDPAAAPQVQLVDSRHEAIKQVPGGWAQSLTAQGERSPAVHDVSSASLAPFLVIRVNGTPIAARGGSWGMDDSRKRIERERLEPYFRLHREAHLNIIRNWLGQNTEDVFYDLADEYGLLVLNDFWESTQDFQLEAQDPALFLANARDVILRYRHHPSIAVWFGRNEGVPQPILNEGLAEFVRTLDGTRLYTGSSNRVNLQDSGPYAYRPPAAYFTGLARGFAVELGTPSLATLEALRASIPEPDLWPPSDTLAYHDWHFGGNGDIASFMSALADRFGPPADLEDFERKAQLMNYDDYRAIFEGFAADLWTRNSGRLIWMTHPAWPSNHWQMYSSDYDTQASFYGVKKACESLHAQMNLPDHALAVINTTRAARRGLKFESRILGLDGREFAARVDAVDVPANTVKTLAPVAIAPVLAAEGNVLVVLELEDADGTLMSQNAYWESRDPASSRALNDLAAQPVRVLAAALPDDDRARVPGVTDRIVEVTLLNEGKLAVLGAKLTLEGAAGDAILPAFYADNYLMLLPGETRRLEIRYPRPGALAGARAAARVKLRGWNVAATSTEIVAAPAETRDSTGLQGRAPAL
jgi:hypothetical protein